MKKTILSLAVAGILVLSSAFSTLENKLVSKSGHVNFFSHTAVEDISADNYKLVSTLETETGEIVFSVPMQSFEFEKALMQKHFNSKKFLDTKTFPKSKFTGNITNLNEIDFSADGTYTANVSGELTIHGVTKAIAESATITVEGAKVIVDVELSITLADYNIAFKKGKPSTNIAKTIDAKVKAEFK
ncbi:MAG: YceI family protein [Flavobacteriaceae bacterium]|nr:YceI family protein [Flavobacteriaceae bacterium]